MYAGKVFGTLKEGSYSVKLVEWDSITARTGTEGIKLVFTLQDPNYGGAVREKDTRLYGYKADDAVEHLVDQYGGIEFDSLAALMDHFKQNSAIAIMTREDGQEVWCF